MGDPSSTPPRSNGPEVSRVRGTLNLAKQSAEMLLKHWADISEYRRLELVAQIFLTLNEIKFGVDQIEPVAPAFNSSPRTERPQLVDLVIEAEHDQPEAKVVLDICGARLEGTSEVSSERRADHPAIARATLGALEGLVGDDVTLVDASVLQIAEAPFAVVSVRYRTEVLVGSAVIENDLNMAVARATLDALNRVVTRPFQSQTST